MNKNIKLKYINVNVLSFNPDTKSTVPTFIQLIVSPKPIPNSILNNGPAYVPAIAIEGNPVLVIEISATRSPKLFPQAIIVIAKKIH